MMWKGVFVLRNKSMNFMILLQCITGGKTDILNHRAEAASAACEAKTTSFFFFSSKLEYL
jgi:hypothetical protein